MITMKTIVHLLSGGLDSTVMLYDLHSQGCRVHCVLFSYHQSHAQELLWAKHHCHRLGVMFTTIELPPLGGLTKEDWVVPFRNPIMLSLAVNLAVQAGAEAVTIGCNADDAANFPDCQWSVMDALNHALMLSRITVEICAPYIQKHKWEIVALGHKLGVQIRETWSCYQGGVEPCGECDACKKRVEAMTFK